MLMMIMMMEAMMTMRTPMIGRRPPGRGDTPSPSGMLTSRYPSQRPGRVTLADAGTGGPDEGALHSRSCYELSRGTPMDPGSLDVEARYIPWFPLTVIRCIPGLSTALVRYCLCGASALWFCSLLSFGSGLGSHKLRIVVTLTLICQGRAGGPSGSPDTCCNVQGNLPKAEGAVIGVRPIPTPARAPLRVVFARGRCRSQRFLHRNIQGIARVKDMLDIPARPRRADRGVKCSGLTTAETHANSQNPLVA